MRSTNPRIIAELNRLINVKGQMMEIFRNKIPHATFQEALPYFGLMRFRYEYHKEQLKIARQQADILQQIVSGVPCFYEKVFQCNNYYPIYKYEWKNRGYVRYGQRFYFDNGNRMIKWERGGDVDINFIINRLSSFSYLASLSPMSNNHQYNME